MEIGIRRKIYQVVEKGTDCVTRKWVGRGQRHFDGTAEPKKRLQNAASPTSQWTRC